MKTAAESKGKPRTAEGAFENSLQFELAQVHGGAGLGIPQAKTLLLVMQVAGRFRRLVLGRMNRVFLVTRGAVDDRHDVMLRSLPRELGLPPVQGADAAGPARLVTAVRG